MVKLGMITSMVGKALQLKKVVGWTDGKDNPAGRGKVNREAKRVCPWSRKDGENQAGAAIAHTGSVMTITQKWSTAKQHIPTVTAEALGSSGRYDQSQQHVEQREAKSVLEIMAVVTEKPKDY